MQVDGNRHVGPNKKGRRRRGDDRSGPALMRERETKKSLNSERCSSSSAPPPNTGQNNSGAGRSTPHREKIAHFFFWVKPRVSKKKIIRQGFNYQVLFLMWFFRNVRSDSGLQIWIDLDADCVFNVPSFWIFFDLLCILRLRRLIMLALLWWLDLDVCL